ncbi:hypothetical protein WISP_150027 [Willisornis vidua]|uniref:Uncharacterized protein n=1 Tax=Willisornis vidua TaxID=1566151 RepID=A0ABQ9CPC0_9PASS|nr:hypothetical protein WISP_150027 [Willisornis vidua]
MPYGFGGVVVACGIGRKVTARFSQGLVLYVDRNRKAEVAGGTQGSPSAFLALEEGKITLFDIHRFAQKGLLSTVESWELEA